MLDILHIIQLNLLWCLVGLAAFCIILWITKDCLESFARPCFHWVLRVWQRQRSAMKRLKKWKMMKALPKSRPPFLCQIFNGEVCLGPSRDLGQRVPIFPIMKPLNANVMSTITDVPASVKNAGASLSCLQKRYGEESKIFKGLLDRLWCLFNPLQLT